MLLLHELLVCWVVWSVSCLTMPKCVERGWGGGMGGGVCVERGWGVGGGGGQCAGRVIVLKNVVGVWEGGRGWESGGRRGGVVSGASPCCM